jgi:hypothetical protein
VGDIEERGTLSIRAQQQEVANKSDAECSTRFTTDKSMSHEYTFIIPKKKSIIALRDTR